MVKNKVCVERQVRSDHTNVHTDTTKKKKKAKEIRPHLMNLEAHLHLRFHVHHLQTYPLFDQKKDLFFDFYSKKKEKKKIHTLPTQASPP